MKLSDVVLSLTPIPAIQVLEDFFCLIFSREMYETAILKIDLEECLREDYKFW
jgi:hypothetical protein